MMKKANPLVYILSIFLPVLFSVSENIAHAQVYNTVTYGLKGKVKSTRLAVYKAIEDNGSYIKGDTLSDDFYWYGKDCLLFNKQGYLLQEKRQYDGWENYLRLEYNGKNQLVKKYIGSFVPEKDSIQWMLAASFEYDKQGLFSKITSYEFDTDNAVIYTYENDSKRKARYAIDDRYFDNDDYYYQEDEGGGDYEGDYWFRWYRNNGQQLRTVCFYSSQEYSDTTFFEYDKWGNQLDRYPSPKTNSYQPIYQYEYGKNGLRVSKKFGYASYNTETDSTYSRFDVRYEYAYNSSKQLVEKRRYINDKLVHMLNITYTPAGKTEQLILCSDSAKYTTIYNRFGDVLSKEYKSIKEDGSKPYFSKTNLSYKYDKYGNWIEKVEYLNVDFPLLIERKIAYYE